MVLGPGETKTLRFRYTLPRSVLPTNGAYNLLLQKQAGVRDQQVSLNILGRQADLTLVADRPLTLPVG